MALTIKPKEQCTWDEVPLGEVTLRLDPGDQRGKTPGVRQMKNQEVGRRAFVKGVLGSAAVMSAKPYGFSRDGADGQVVHDQVSPSGATTETPQ